MTKKIFRSICIVALAVAISCVMLATGGLYSYFTMQQQNHLKTLTELTYEAVSDLGTEYFDNIEVNGLRITVINVDGKVIYDTLLNHEEMPNHLEREEIKEAFETGTGESTRYSDSLTEYQFYYAKKLENGNVIRLSISQSTVFALIAESAVPLLTLFIFVLLLSLLLAFRLSKIIVKPLNNLNLDDPLSSKHYSEINPLLVRISSQQRQLKKQEEELLRRENEFNTITEGMSEGLVLLNGRGIILSINTSAKKLLNLEKNCAHKDFISIINNENIREITRCAMFGKVKEESLTVSGSVYEVKANPILTDGMVSGVVMIMLDITEKAKSEKIRREFTSNVSHELKTPLHSISGYAELLAHKMVKEEDIPHFAKKIYQESGRLITLVEDIIRLSRIEENQNEPEFCELNLYTLAEASLERLMPLTEEKNISIDFSGENSVICGNLTLISEIIYNLSDNAIKYNKENGNIKINIKNETDHAVLSVSDTGIGIENKHLNRIFERFYRVDKSHSKNVGGTGLGLSIVKHACLIHSAEINIESQKDVGTKVTVKFPKNKVLP